MYDHGPDPIVLDDNNVAEFTTNPPPGVDVKRAPTNGSNVEAYNPEAPGIGAPAVATIPGFMPNFSVPPPPIPQQVSMNPMGGMMSMNPYMQQNMVPGQQNFMRGGFGRGRGRGIIFETNY